MANENQVDMDEMAPLKNNDMSGGDRRLPDEHQIDIDHDHDRNDA